MLTLENLFLSTTSFARLTSELGCLPDHDSEFSLTNGLRYDFKLAVYLACKHRVSSTPHLHISAPHSAGPYSRHPRPSNITSCPGEEDIEGGLMDRCPVGMKKYRAQWNSRSTIGRHSAGGMRSRSFSVSGNLPRLHPSHDVAQIAVHAVHPSAFGPQNAGKQLL